MKYMAGMILGLLLLASAWAVGQAQSTTSQTQSKTTPKKVLATNQDRGQQVWEQNCSRCHNAPAGFPASISGTISMHMRVRAGLSEPDYKALRKFLNP
jgi:cytochrome c5